jgi:hypothetical protein
MRLIEPFRRVRRAAAYCAGLLTFLLIVFVVANVCAYVALRPAPARPNLFSDGVPRGAPASVALYRQVFNLTPDEDPFGRLDASPPMARHPTLPFITAPTKNRYVHVGREGLRYEPGWTDEQVASLLTGSRPLIFAFGGSTTFGHGVADDETWPFSFNREAALPEDDASARTPGVMLNFGAHAYDQRTEISKLIYLLTNGYRPAAVVFLDGWNDVLLSRSNMRHVDRVIYHGFSTGHGEITFTPGGRITQLRTRDQFLNFLPLWQYLRARGRAAPKTEAIRLERDAFIDGFDFLEADHVYHHWAELGEAHREHYKRLIIESYRSNLRLLNALADGYGFKVNVFFQPIGILDETNSFLAPQARTAVGYRYIKELVDTVRDAIARGELDMIDISQSLEGFDGPRYIDPVHYTPAAHWALARVIARQLAHRRRPQSMDINR